MNKIIELIILVVLLTGCATSKTLPILWEISPVKTLYAIDFTPFTSQGFLITPEKYTDSYESIGLINYETLPGSKCNSIIIPNPKYKVGYSDPEYLQIYEWDTDTLLILDALKDVHTICVGMGADAIMNFDFERISQYYGDIKNPTYIGGYRITGFAIKRKNK